MASHGQGQRERIPKTIQEALDTGHNVVLYPEVYKISRTIVLREAQWVLPMQRREDGRLFFDVPDETTKRIACVPAWSQNVGLEP